MLERRKYPRVRARNRISVSKIGHQDAKSSRHGEADWRFTVDISEGGLRFISPEPLPKEATLRIHLVPMHPGDSISLVGVVRWSQRLHGDDVFHVGVELQGVEKEHIKAWKQHVARKLSHTSEGMS